MGLSDKERKQGSQEVKLLYKAVRAVGERYLGGSWENQHTKALEKVWRAPRLEESYDSHFKDLVQWLKSLKSKTQKEVEEDLQASFEWHKKHDSEKRAEEEAKKKVMSFLSEKRQKYDSLGCGCKDGVFYFGTKVFKDGQSYDAVVTSEKKLYVNTLRKVGTKNYGGHNEIRHDFKLNYKDDFYEECLDHIFSKEAIEQWLFADCSKITIKAAYNELINLFKKYIYLDDQRKYSLLACYRIAGFFMPIWKARARLFIWAEPGTSKSRLTQILHNTGFNSIALGDWTLALMKATIESTRGETHIDDFETLPEELKNATIRLVKVGYMRGFKAGKMSDGVKRKPEVNDLFNTTTLNNTEGLDFISQDRCEILRIPKIANKKFDSEPDFDQEFWEKMRSQLYILGLKYPLQVKESYELVQSDKLRGRLLSIIKPELAIARLISDKVFNDIEEFWAEETDQSSSIDYESDWEFLAFKQIYKTLSTHSTNSTNSTLSTLSTSDYFTLLDDVVRPIGQAIYSDEEFKKKKRSMSIFIGKSLKDPRFKKRLVRGKTQFAIKWEDLIELLRAKNFLNPIKDILKEVESVDSVDRVDGKTPKENDLPWDDRAEVWQPCSKCQELPCNEASDGKLYCKKCYEEKNPVVEEEVVSDE